MLYNNQNIIVYIIFLIFGKYMYSQKWTYQKKKKTIINTKKLHKYE